MEGKAATTRSEAGPHRRRAFVRVLVLDCGVPLHDHVKLATVKYPRYSILAR